MNSTGFAFTELWGQVLSLSPTKQVPYDHPHCAEGNDTITQGLRAAVKIGRDDTLEVLEHYLLYLQLNSNK